MNNDFAANFSSAVVDAVERAARSVVTVWGGHRPISGVVVAPSIVLTVDHVLEGDEARVIPKSGEKYPTSVLRRDPSSDLALLKVPNLDAPALEVGADP